MARGSSGMWGRPATANQIAALKAHGNFDGAYYSMGRASQAISASVQAAGAATAATSLLDSLLNQQLSQVEQRISQAVARVEPEYIVPNSHPITNTTQENTKMSELVAVTQSAVPNIAAVVAMSPSASEDAVPFDFIGELEKRHLNVLMANGGRANPQTVREIEKGWAVAKVSTMTKFARAQMELVALLSQASGQLTVSPEALAQEMLWNACSPRLEREMMEATLSNHGHKNPTQVIDEWVAEVDHRIELAKMYAASKVELAQIKAASQLNTAGNPSGVKTKNRSGEGEVTGVKPFGAFIKLPDGESGLLHKSRLNQLNNGEPVLDATEVLEVGQKLRVRIVGTNAEGKISLALAKAA